MELHKSVEQPREDSLRSIPLTLGYEKRLHHRSDFQRFFGQSQVFRLRNCTVFRVPNDRSHFRLGMTYKVRASSVERNQVRRAIRETFRRLGPSLGAYDYNIVIGRVKKLGHPYPKRLSEELIERFSDSG